MYSLLASLISSSISELCFSTSAAVAALYKLIKSNFCSGCAEARLPGARGLVYRFRKGKKERLKRA